MIIDTYKENTLSNINCDICIVGAGAAGITLAKEFSKNYSKKIIIIESGGYEQEDKIAKLKEGVIDYKNGALNYTLEGTRGKWLGGTTNYWGGCSAPFTQSDFDTKKWIENSGWPINYNDLKNYYLRAHQLLQLGKFDYNADRLEKSYYKNTIPIDSQNGIIHKFYRFKIGEAIRFKKIALKLNELNSKINNVSFLLHAHCQTLNFENNKKLKSIDITNHKNLSLNIKAQKFILAGGAIENSRILLNTEKSNRPAIGNEFDQVGRYFAEHPHIEIGHLFYEKKNKFINNYKPIAVDENLNLLKDSILLKTLSTNENFRKKNKINRFTLRINSINVDNIAVKKTKKYWNELVFPDFFSKIERYKNINNINNSNVAQLYAVFEQSPNFNSRVKLTEPNDVDAFGTRKVLMNWQLTNQDKQTALISSNILTKHLLKNIKNSSIKLNSWIYDFKNCNESKPLWGCHQMGTTRMGSNPKNSVVDKNCKLHKVDNLYIAGASVFSTTSDVNPTLNIIAMSIRLADHLKQIFK